MALEIFDEYGNNIVDGNSKLIRFLGTLSLSPASPTSGSISNPRLWEGTPFFLGGSGLIDGSNLSVFFDGNRNLCWQFRDNEYRVFVNLLYGVF